MDAYHLTDQYFVASLIGNYGREFRSVVEEGSLHGDPIDQSILPQVISFRQQELQDLMDQAALDGVRIDNLVNIFELYLN